MLNFGGVVRLANLAESVPAPPSSPMFQPPGNGHVPIGSWNGFDPVLDVAVDQLPILKVNEWESLRNGSGNEPCPNYQFQSLRIQDYPEIS